MPKYAYARVSTVGESTHGNSLQSQVNQLLAEGGDRSFIFAESVESQFEVS